MGHRQDMNPNQRLQWDCDNYKKRLKANKGRNFEYWSDDKHADMLERGWNLYDFKESGRSWAVIQVKKATSSIATAKEVVTKLRKENNFARIVCGYEKNKQRVKMYSVIYKHKPNK